MHLTYPAKGFVTIGDPHLHHKTPGRRLDENFADTILAKLAEALCLSSDADCVPIITGDLFHKPGFNKIEILSQLSVLFKASKFPVVVLSGNHDLHEFAISEQDTLMLVSNWKNVEVVGGQDSLEIPGIANIHFCPHECAIPDELPVSEIPQFLVTHHDLAFDGAYPGALPLKEIAGCAHVINGHMHGTKPSVVLGGTTWHNPGNITRLSIDMAGHIPCILKYVEGSLVPVTLRYDPVVFNTVGLMVAPATGQSADSLFGSLLKEESVLEASKTDEASLLWEDIETSFAESTVEPEVQLVIKGLFSRVSG